MSNETEIEWFVFDKRGNLPEYVRTVGRSNDGTIYLPVAISDENELLVMAMSSDDEENCVLYSEHYYAPSKWLAKTFPKCKEICEAAERNIPGKN